MTAKLNFVRQQGFQDATSGACAFQYPALMWQPRALGILVLVGLALQAWPYFLGLSALPFWNAALPRLNPFDALYNRFRAAPKRLPRLDPSPGPRRFAQAMAASFMLAIAVTLFTGWRLAAWGIEALLVVAVGALIFGRFCFGSYLFLLVSGQGRFANRTLPWSRPEPENVVEPV